MAHEGIAFQSDILAIHPCNQHGLIVQHVVMWCYEAHVRAQPVFSRTIYDTFGKFFAEIVFGSFLPTHFFMLTKDNSWVLPLMTDKSKEVDQVLVVPKWEK